MRRAQGGDRAAFSALVPRYWKPVYGWLAGLCGDEHLAEDLTQDTFVHAWQGLPQLTSPEAFRVWLFRIARNEWLSGRRTRTPIAGLTDPEERAESAGGPVAEAMEREADAALRAAIRRLAEPYRDAYLLWTQQEVPHHEIASILGVSEETVRWRVCKARQFLVHKLKAHLPNSP